jgi:hypothetical protein
MKSGETLNTKILDNFANFLTVGRTQDSDLGHESYGRSKLGNIMSYIPSIWFNFDFVSSLFFKVQPNHAYAASCNMWPYPFLTKRKSLPII